MSPVEGAGAVALPDGVAAFMRALQIVRFSGLGELELRDVPAPASRAGESLIAVGAVALSRSDVAVMLDRAGDDNRPLVPGTSVAGTVIRDVRYPRGTRVAVDPYLRCGECARCRAARGCAEPRVLGRHIDGGLAQLMSTSGDLVPLPRTMSMAEGAAIAASGAIASKLLFDDAGLIGGERLLLTGSTGALGLTVIQLARAMGCHVSALVTRADRLQLAEAAGAHAAVSMELDGPAGAVGRIDPVDVIVHLATDASWIGGLLDAMRPGGRVVMRRVRSGRPVAMDVGKLAARGLTLVGSSGSGEAGLGATVSALARSSVHPVIDTVRNWEEHRAAFQQFAARSSKGAIVLEVS